MSGEPLLEVHDLRVVFPTDEGPLVAVDDLSFTLEAGVTLGVVGESGSGKTVSSLAIMGLLPPDATVTGELRYRGEDLLTAPPERLRSLRGDRVAMVFQDALTALNPVFTVGHQIAEAVRTHREVTKADAWTRSVELLDLVGVPNPSVRADQYPHEFSGGMRQRAMIAMAIANDPDLLIADEPTTALDVTVQAQVLDVLERIQEQTDSALLLITHDLGVVAGVADRVLVMYAGRDVEQGTVEEVFASPRHPYTRDLLRCLPRIDGSDAGAPLHRIPGQPCSLLHPPPGCVYWPRCADARRGICEVEVPVRLELGAGRSSRCHFASELGTLS
jgi:oligopeptide/dipeptide ABC transporter ATP-binding protein